MQAALSDDERTRVRVRVRVRERRTVRVCHNMLCVSISLRDLTNKALAPKLLNEIGSTYTYADRLSDSMLSTTV